MCEEFDLDGLLFKRFGSKGTKGARFAQKKWNLYYVNLMGGALYYYKDEEADKPKGVIKLGDLQLTKNDSQGSKKKFCFSLKNQDCDFLFRTETEEEYNKWIKGIEENKAKPPKQPLSKEKKQHRAQSLALRAKKKMISKAATSSVGKKLMKSQAPEEITNLLLSFKKVVEKTKGSKTATEMENAVLKIGIKCYFIIDDGRLKMEDLLTADKPFRTALEQFQKCYDHIRYSRNPNKKALQEKFAQVKDLLQTGGDTLKKLLEPHIKPKNLAMLSSIIDVIADADFLMSIFIDESLDEPLQELISAGEHYTQFHFYA